jgi:hypothetical protein
MYDIYKEEICKHCPFAGPVSEPVQVADASIKYVECQRDNEDAKEHFILSHRDENFLWLRQIAELEHCIYNANAYRDNLMIIHYI